MWAWARLGYSPDRFQEERELPTFYVLRPGERCNVVVGRCNTYTNVCTARWSVFCDELALLGCEQPSFHVLRLGEQPSFCVLRLGEQPSFVFCG